MKIKSLLEKTRSYIEQLRKIHAGRSWIRLVIYVMTLLILTPISLTLELIRDLCDLTAEWLTNVSSPLQKWAEYRKPNDKKSEKN